MSLVYRKIKTQVGTLKLVANSKALVAILWGDEKRVKLGSMKKDVSNAILAETEKQLAEYFDGKRKTFSIPLEATGTEFQNQIWKELRRIPYGKTISYLELAKKMGRPKGARAAGMATGKNPISILVPCHRVIGADGRLTGFAGGISAKKTLLQLEAASRSKGIRSG